MTTAPPKPRLALRVGVTGHRQARLDPDQIARIEEQVVHVLGAIDDALQSAARDYAEFYASDDPKRYFVSALADGADTLAAKCAMTRGWRLLAPLPFSREVYADDFAAEDITALTELVERADAVAELDGLRSTPAQEDRAYLQAGIVTIDESDFVIAIWDGEDARGVAGTANIKEAALNAGKPVVWINAHEEAAPLCLGADMTEIPFSLELAKAAVDRIVAPPAASDIEHAFSGRRTHALAAYQEYAREKPHRFNYGSFFQFWEKAFAGKWPFAVRLNTRRPKQEIDAARKQTLAVQLNASEHDRAVFDDIIIPRFAWADHLAIHYGNLYRSSYFFNYLFAALAVFLALFDLVAGGFGFGSKTLWISIEVSIIVLILSVTTAGKRGRWHEKWIDYRQLAEELRQYRLYFLTLGRVTREEDFASGEAGESASWVDWYFRATRREAGMTAGRFGASETRRIAETILTQEIRPQIAYHSRKAETLHKMEHRLHILGEIAFAATLLVCLLYLSIVFFKSGDIGGFKDIAYKAEKVAKGWVTMLTGFLPALGAAFFGIRVQGEFGSTAERSHATASQLEAIAAKFEALSTAESPKIEKLRAGVEEAARAMLLENTDWRLLYISKPLNLPG